MKAIPGVILGSALILATTGVALSQNASGGATSTTNSTGAVDVQGPIDAQGKMQATTNAETQADASADEAVTAIRERAKKASAKTCAVVEKQLSQISRQIDAEANEKGDVVVAGRIAPEFGMTTEGMAAEQARFNTGLGELTIAHTLMANSKTQCSAEQLFQLQREGLGWGQIAHGLNLRVGEVTAAMKSEYNVAAGTAKADGKPATIRSGTRVAASTKTNAKAGPASVGAASSMGVGVKVGN